MYSKTMGSGVGVGVYFTMKWKRRWAVERIRPRVIIQNGTRQWQGKP
uniref:Uncharacterized protein n=1 Tax=Anguilla anguilla TaxID=7936 RepID=A0A0E9UUJ7_ANGAN